MSCQKGNCGYRLAGPLPRVCEVEYLLSFERMPITASLFPFPQDIKRSFSPQHCASAQLTMDKAGPATLAFMQRFHCACQPLCFQRLPNMFVSVDDSMSVVIAGEQIAFSRLSSSVLIAR